MATLSNVCRRNFLCTILGRNRTISNRLISTSEKKKEATEVCPPVSGYQKPPDFSKPLENKNWISFGFNKQDKELDRYTMHMAFFFLITICMCGGGFIMAYFPDKKELHWAKRQAFITLHERELQGLEPIDRNFIDPAKIVLPRDEDLSDNDIII